MTELAVGRTVMDRARQSRRPSRQGWQAGTSSRVRALDGSGMPELLENVLARASCARSVDETLQVLLSLDGHVPADVSRRALTGEESAALTARFERPGRAGGNPVFTGVLGLTSAGKVAIGVPGQPGLESRPNVVGVAARVPWTRDDVEIYERAVERARITEERDVAACREWLGRARAGELREMLMRLRGALLHTAPVLLYRGDRIYTNFREVNNLTGKSLFPGHPDCALLGLEQLPLQEWSDDQAVLVACLSLLSRSGGNHRIEECNGMQLDLRRVAELFQEKHRLYGEAGGELCVAGLAPAPVPAALEAFAIQLGRVRSELLESHLLYRQISGPVLSKRERIATFGTEASLRESAILESLRSSLPLRGRTCEEMVGDLRRSSAWLTLPHGRFETGLEDLIYQTVSACSEHFSAQFSLSRGFRSLPMLVEALRAEDWARICAWELPEFFCCVVPSPSALAFFGGSWEGVADAAWAMSARMQFNSWHFLAAHLPKVAVVEARDYFTPPTMPDVSSFSDQHHRGHVFNGVRFTIRSPQPVRVDGRQLNGFVDLRLVRCGGDPFEERDMLDAHRISGLVAAATECVAERVVRGENVEVHAFDHVWHRGWAELHLR